MTLQVLPRFAVGAAAALCMVATVGSSSAAAERLHVVTRGVSAGQSLARPAPWGVDVRGGTPSRVDFFVDGRLLWRERERPYRFNGDKGSFSPASFAPGKHTLTAVAHGAGSPSAATTSVVIPRRPPGSLLPTRLGPSRGREYFVDDRSGRDSNRGTLEAPWRTIARAWKAAPRTGSTISVRAGSYAGQINLTGRTASAANPITVRAYPGERVVLTGPATPGYPAVYIARAAGVRLQGLEITNDAGDGIKVDSGRDIELVGNDIHDVGQQGIIVGAGSSTTAPTYSENVQIWSNRIHHNGGWWDNDDPYALIGTHGIYYGNTGSNTDGIRHGAVGGLIANNLFYDQPNGYHLQVGSQNDGLIIANNTFDDAHAEPDAAGNSIQLYGENNRYATKNVVVVNNAILNSAHRGIYGSGPTLQGNVVLHNLAFNNPLGNLVANSGESALFTLGSGNITGRDPRLVNRAEGNYRPSAGSPLIDHADPAYAPPTDATGMKRKGVPDIGALEHAG